MNKASAPTTARSGWSAGWKTGAWRALLALGGAAALLAVAIACAAWLAGLPPYQAARLFFHGALGSSYAWADTLKKATILAFCAWSVALSFRAGLFNIGAEGQFALGAATAAAWGLLPWSAWLPATLGIPTVLLAGALGGAAWALVAGLLHRYRGVPEVIATLLLNFLGLILLGFLVRYPWLLRATDTSESRSAALPESLVFSEWGPSGFHAGVFWTLPCAAVLYLWLFYRPGGYALRATGYNPRAAACLGVDSGGVKLFAFGWSGALAGMGGALAVLELGYLPETLYPGYGYLGIAAALAGLLHPLGILLSAFFFAALAQGSHYVSTEAAVPSQLTYFLQGLALILLLAAGFRLPRREAEPAVEEPGPRPEKPASSEAGG